MAEDRIGIKILFPHPFDADVRVLTEGDKPNGRVIGMEIMPIFMSPKSMASLAYVEARLPQEVRKGVLQVSGIRGNLRYLDLSKNVVPFVLKPVDGNKEEPAPEAADGHEQV